MLKQIVLVSIMILLTHQDCGYTTGPNQYTYKYTGPAFDINYTVTACKEYIGKPVCCNQFNDLSTADNLKAIDSLFGSKGGGCDICAVNMKRFWCEYACSPRQSEFLWAADELEQFPDPQKPGSTLLAQRIKITIEVNTACKLFQSCKRNPFVASVSAMSSTAGFLNFQGHNAVNSGHQYIEVNFSRNASQSLTFLDPNQTSINGELNQCNYTTKDDNIHGFEFLQNCTCNACEQACDPNEGFQYTEPKVLEDFNYVLIISTYGVVIIVGVVLTVWRIIKRKKLNKLLQIQKD